MNYTMPLSFAALLGLSSAWASADNPVSIDAIERLAIASAHNTSGGVVRRARRIARFQGNEFDQYLRLVRG